MIIKKIILISILFLIISFQMNCAIFQRKNLILVNAVEDNLIPEDDTKKLFALPFIVPIGMVAGILDVFVVHPISVLPRSGSKTISVLWTPDPEIGYVTKMGAIPFSAIATPPFFGIVWLHYWFFDDSDSNNDYASIDLTDEQWSLNLQKDFNEKNWDKIEKSFIDCRSHSNYERLIPIYIQSYHHFMADNHSRAAYNILNCLSIIETFHEELESFYILILQKDHSQKYIMEYRNSIAYYFAKNTSKKGSQALVQMLADPKLDASWIPFLVDKIFEIGVEDHKKAIIQKFR